MNILSIPKIDGHIMVTTAVINEIKSSQASNIFNIFSEKHSITCMEPDNKSIQYINHQSRKIGQKGLSKVDCSVLALAYMLSQTDEVIIYTEDYAVKNVAHTLSIQTKSIKNKGGNQKRTYKYKCKSCNTIYLQSEDDCDICGGINFIRSRN